MRHNPIIILFAGDFILPLTEAGSLFSVALKNVLLEKDFSIANLEAPSTNSNDRILKTGNSFKSSPASIRHLVNGHFDAVALANNHSRDFGDQGVVDTLAICRKHGIQPVGARGKHYRRCKAA
jgi:poly-gamma-glutamate capsule biosynthesis protein CapA/YwtB (metallophosphatase superfamily)